ncbi:MAG: TolC family protein [Phycisphaerae bacterium]|nr:TolC family protein [Phycisphaerae bacterium]
MRSFFLISFVSFLSIMVVGCKSGRQEIAPPWSDDLIVSQADMPVPDTRDFEEPIGTIVLGEAMRLVILGNPDLAVLPWDVRVAEADLIQAGLRPNPELGFELEEFGGSGDYSGFGSTQATLQISQLIESGGKRIKREQLATMDIELAQAQGVIKQQDILAETAKRFVVVLAAQEKVKLTGDLVNISQEVVDAVSRRVTAGEDSPVKQTRWEVELATARLALDTARGDLAKARGQLAAMWGGYSAQFEKVQGELESVPVIPELDVLTQALENNPEIAIMDSILQRFQRAVELEKAGAIPDPTVSAGIQRFEESDDTAFIIGLSLPLPLYDRNQGNLLKAQRQLSRAEVQNYAIKARLTAQLTDVYQELLIARKMTQTLKNDILPGVQDTFNAIRKGYQQGKFDYLEVLDAQRGLFESRGRYLDALSRHHKAWSDMERLIGGYAISEK